MAFDTLTIVLSIINALDRPRRSNADIMVYLRDDGAPFFLVSYRDIVSPLKTQNAYSLSLVCIVPLKRLVTQPHPFNSVYNRITICRTDITHQATGEN